MKIFHHKSGHEAGTTMTVAELKAELDKYPDNMAVFGIWEGVAGYVIPENFSVQECHKGDGREACDCLHICVEDY